MMVPPPNKESLRQIVQDNLDETVAAVNQALQGRQLAGIKPGLERLGRGNKLPHWFAQLAKKGTLPNLDGKTIGSVIEMLFAAIIEDRYLADLGVPPLRINPASGVDLPDLELGVKSPSENFCTSEPFFSAYERLIGSEFDIVALLTDYQTAKSKPPLKLQIIKSAYLHKTEIADKNLCAIALGLRDWMLGENESWAKKVFRFLAYVNQSDWLGRQIVTLLKCLPEEDATRSTLEGCITDFDRYNRRQLARHRDPLPDEAVNTLLRIADVRPIALGVIDAADNWIVETHKQVARTPTDNEWHRLVSGPLDGKIRISFALQWRYNFRPLFNSV